MKNAFTVIVMVLCSASLLFASSEGDLWLGSTESPTQLKVVGKAIAKMETVLDGMKFDGEVLDGGPGPVLMGGSNLITDAYTSVFSSPTMFEYEGYYSFEAMATVAHVMQVKLGAPDPSGPSILATGYAWTGCTADVYLPPVPISVGIAPFAPSPILWTLPGTGKWLLAIGISGFPPLKWEWVGFANYFWEGCGEMEGMIFGPDLLRCPSGIDIVGGTICADHNNPAFDLFTEPGCLSATGDGKGASRPWCFQVH